MGKLEAKYQMELASRIEERMPGAIVMKNDPNYIQGIPDLTVLFNDRWATLEVKKSSTAPAQPNQPYYVDLMNSMSFSSFIYPENEEEVLDAMEEAFRTRR